MSKGLYQKEFEKDACGIGLIAHIKNHRSHEIIENGLTMLKRMEHRGGVASDGQTGDGAGIQTQIPHHFFKELAFRDGVELPDFSTYGVAMLMLSKDQDQEAIMQTVDLAISESGLEKCWMRPVPVQSNHLGQIARASEPLTLQLFLKKEGLESADLDRKLYVFRKICESKVHQLFGDEALYIPSCSSQVIVYKGELRTWQLESYYIDLQEKNYTSSFAIVHSRYSTNTMPEWRLAQPFRFIAHNGEINTIKGNINKMISREALLASTDFTKSEIEALLPICKNSFSDSANLDMAVELLVMGGRPIEQVMTMLMPAAWENDEKMSSSLRAFYQFHAAFMEPWDGPAAVCFANGTKIGAAIDRNGLRPTRFTVTSDDKIIFASETGVVDIAPEKVLQHGTLSPGQMLLIDLEEGKLYNDAQVKRKLASQFPYWKWNESLERLSGFEVEERWRFRPSDELLEEQLLFGYSKEDLKFILAPMAQKGAEPVGSMGNDAPLAVFAKRNAHISNYFKQLFAQVSNPAIDPIREKAVMSLSMYLGAGENVWEQGAAQAKRLFLEQPVLTPARLLQLKSLRSFQVAELDASYPAQGNLNEALVGLALQAQDLVRRGTEILVISNKTRDKNRIPIPSLLITGLIHQHLLDSGLRSKSSLVVEAGDVLETHHFATLIGNGASAVCPYLAFESLLALHSEEDPEELVAGYIEGIGYGLRKILSKMGISTLQSYECAQIFEIVGLDDEVVNLCFTGTPNRISGKGFEQLERELLENYQLARDEVSIQKQLADGGIYQWRAEGEKHLFNPQTIHLLQKSTRTGDFDLFKKYMQLIDDQAKENITLRSLFEFQFKDSIPLEEVEPIEKILKRFSTGAMSFGSISEEAHTTIARAMNQIGGKSNSGEGGEDAKRFEPEEDGASARSAIKQVASGRFGVTAHYLVNADEIQIKIAQGAKPGEGGQLPGLKVDKNIARLRHSTPGVTLISPPPHHDIYSIEDLAQLIYDLKNVNSEADINVKLVAEAGVGTIAAGVAKANADAILIAGHDGGTGASPLSSIQHAGIPWEIGLAEAHQTLLRNGLRGRVRLQTDGQIRTAKDLAIAAMLGAEEWGVATAVLVVQGCIMMRKCHLNTCPVGIATQNPELRRLFTGRVEDIVNFFQFMAMELREIMAALGVRTVDELVGRTDLLSFDRAKANERAGTLDLSALLYRNATFTGTQHKSEPQDHALENVLDQQLIERSKETLAAGLEQRFPMPINNENRSVGAMLSGEVAKKFGANGLPEGTLTIHFKGTAGQSFGAFLSKGLTFNLEGEANDYVGKGLSGGKITVIPHADDRSIPSKNMSIGNVALYGATSGSLFVKGRAGERFAVRNSGAVAVVEGVGDHACEYMTGGKVVILAGTGKNFAAGMSGGVAFVLEEGFDFEENCNLELVDLEAPSTEDFASLHRLIQLHFLETGSAVAKALLEEWELRKMNFVKVMPLEYKKALEASMNKEKVEV